MIRNLGTNRILWLLNSLLSLIAAFAGVLRPGIYSRVVSTEVLPGVISQDWFTMLVPLIQFGQRIEYQYSIYILDLSFIMPTFAILAFMAAKNRGLGLILTPALYILGATLLFPVGLGEIIKPFFNLPVNLSEVPLYFGISILFFMLAAIYLRNLKIPAPSS
jgi:hypothetical protein